MQQLRIANLVPQGSDAHRYLQVDDSDVAGHVVSERWELAAPVRFRSELDKTLAALAYVEAGVRADAAGCSAAIINAFGDYGLKLLRQAVAMPVVGPGQASIQAAMLLGERFGILTVWPRSEGATYERLLDDYGARARCTGVQFVTSEAERPEHQAAGGFGPILQSDPGPLLDRIEASAHALIASGSDVIVLGCVCMVPIAAELERRLGVPVINPLVAAHRQAEMLASLRPSHEEPTISKGELRTLRAAVTGVAGSGVVATGEHCTDACEVLAGLPAS